MIIEGKQIDGFLAQIYYRQLSNAYQRLSERKSAKHKLDEHLAVIKKQPKLGNRHVQELKKRVDILIEKERMILHPDNRYVAVHQKNIRHKEIEKLEKVLKTLEIKYAALRKKGVNNLAMKKIEAKIEFLRTKLAFLRQ